MDAHGLIHATFEDGPAFLLIQPDMYVIEKSGERCSETKIVRVGRV